MVHQSKEGGSVGSADVVYDGLSFEASEARGILPAGSAPHLQWLKG